ncbi:uncharacterized protein LOC131666902 [Phymastichus coffea]|uniref:uncharacterized protein LOC131666902 n=1 Tax=Phymastichus coffea TaxID=108790 RepID=UPI00273B38DC|nr:uncharacterized protein LOC131666902 [Phymastichus coffea]
MEICDILIDDDLEIQILDDKNNKDSTKTTPLKSVKETSQINPVQEYLSIQLNAVQSQIDQTVNNIEIIDSVTKEILSNLSNQAAYRADELFDLTDSDNDLFSSTGEPVIKNRKKKRRNKIFEKQRVIVVKDVWQRIVDDKWVIGVVIKSTTTCVLKEPTLYMCPIGHEDNCSGISAFWTLDNGLWLLAEDIDSMEELVATAVFDLPPFDADNTCHEVHGTIFCEFDGKLFQTPVPSVKLEPIAVVDGSCAVDFDQFKFSILTLKALSVDKVVVLPMNPNSNTGKRLMKFLETYAFQEIDKVCVVRDIGSLQYCILEVLQTTDDGDLKIFLSARSAGQLSTMVQLMREDFPELIDLEKQQMLDDAAEVLCEELQLYLTCDDEAKLQRARVKTDLLIP